MSFMETAEEIQSPCVNFYSLGRSFLHFILPSVRKSENEVTREIFKRKGKGLITLQKKEGQFFWAQTIAIFLCVLFPRRFFLLYKVGTE